MPAVHQAEKDAIYSLVASMRLEKEGGLWVRNCIQLLSCPCCPCCSCCPCLWVSSSSRGKGRGGVGKDFDGCAEGREAIVAKDDVEREDGSHEHTHTSPSLPLYLLLSLPLPLPALGAWGRGRGRGRGRDGGG